MVSPVRFERTTNGLKGRCSTAELRARDGASYVPRRARRFNVARYAGSGFSGSTSAHSPQKIRALADPSRRPRHSHAGSRRCAQSITHALIPHSEQVHSATRV